MMWLKKVGNELNYHISKDIYITYTKAGTQVHVVNLTIHTNPRTTNAKVSAAILTPLSCIYRNDPSTFVKQSKNVLKHLKKCMKNQPTLLTKQPFPVCHILDYVIWMCSDYVQTCGFKGLAHFKLYNLNRLNTRFYCGPHCTNNFSAPQCTRTSINLYAWFICKPHNKTMNTYSVDINIKLAAIYINERKT